MSRLRNEARASALHESAEAAEATQRVAFFLILGVELADALCLAAEPRRRVVLRLRRMLERERLKGARRHWSYDLNRHVALKQALDRFEPAGG